MKPRCAIQRRRRGISVASAFQRFPSSVGATYLDAAPTGLMDFMGAQGYKDVAPTVLPNLSQRRIVAELDALLPAILDKAFKGEL